MTRQATTHSISGITDELFSKMHDLAHVGIVLRRWVCEGA